MANKLKNLKITSTDLVTQGANPESFIRLFKRCDDAGNTPLESELNRNLINKIATGIANGLAGVFGKSNTDDTVNTVTKNATTFGENMDMERLRAVASEAWDCSYALSDSLASIIRDGEMPEDAKRDMMFQSLDEFAEALRNAIPSWATGKLKEQGGDLIAKSAEQLAAFEKLWEKYGGTSGEPTSEPKNDPVGDGTEIQKSVQKEETDTMKIDKSKMTPEEQATLAEFEKKYGEAAPEEASGDLTKSASGTPSAEMHPEVKKALDEAAAVRKAQDVKIEELTKSLEVAGLTAVAKKYEVIGKKAEELAPKLYDLKKAGGTAYDDYVALLNEQVTLVEKGGMFAELGRSTSGSPGAGNEISIKAAEIAKANNSVMDAAAIAKAFEENPELAAQYEREYAMGRAN